VTHEGLARSAVTVATTRLGHDSCSHVGARYCGLHGTGTVDWTLRAPARGESMLPTRPQLTKLVTPSYECGQRLCQAPSQADKACGVGEHFPVGRASEKAFRIGGFAFQVC
jgi:hypothetical protein